MKILFYNWVDYLDPEKRGGGVSIYQYNIIEKLSENPENEIYFICAGISYDLFSKKIRIEKMKHGLKAPTKPMKRVKRFDMINCPVLSPGHHSYGKKSQVHQNRTEKVFFDFVKKHGQFDVIHFNNLEGIPAGVLNVKKQYPETKVILSMHNYYPLCSQVNLWYQEKEHCDDYYYGKKCIDCIPNEPDEALIKRANATAYKLKKWGVSPKSKWFPRLFMPIVGSKIRIDKWLGREEVEKDFGVFDNMISGHPFIDRRTEMVRLINENCDHVLAVSDRVREICIQFGIKDDLVVTDYIGTKHAELFEETATPTGLITNEDGTITLTYLGYMRRDKGFFFLVDACYDMPKHIAEKINLVIAARNSEPEQLAKLYGQIWKFNSISHADGYTHDSLPKILENTDVGIVPVQWEDNLPQVAIEMHARKIPLITSNRGGAQELGNNGKFIFKSSSKEELYQVLERIINGEVKHEDYWATAMKPVSMDEHCEKLTNVFFRSES